TGRSCRRLSQKSCEASPEMPAGGGGTGGIPDWSTPFSTPAAGAVDHPELQEPEERTGTIAASPARTRSHVRSLRISPSDCTVEARGLEDWPQAGIPALWRGEPHRTECRTEEDRPPSAGSAATGIT